MSGLLKRFRPKEADSIDGLDPSPPQSNTGSAAPPPEKAEKDAALSSGRDVEEAETNRRLAIFEKAHRWDPNLGDEQLHDIDDAVNARDPNSEARIFDEVFENSPYPEVRQAFSLRLFCYPIRHMIFYCNCLTLLRFGQLSGIMTKSFHATPSEHG
jgi:hypothetical protein